MRLSFQFVVVTYGSDWDNIPEPDPWFALEGMVTRQYVVLRDGSWGKILRFESEKTALLGPRKWPVVEPN